MKIAVLIRNFKRNAGGAERYCVELSERLSEYHEVHIFCQSYERSSLPIKFHKISRYFDKPRFLNQLLFSYLTNKATSRGKFDIVHSHELVAHADVFTLHVPCFKSTLLNVSGLKKNLRILNTLVSPRKVGYLWLEKKQMQNAHKSQFISVSEYLLRNINLCYPSLRNISIAYPGTSEKFTQNESNIPNKSIDLKNDFLIPKSALILLLVANNFHKKGLPTIIKSLQILQNKNIFLAIAGNDKQKKSNIPKLISKQLYFLGPIHNMANLYRQVDILIHPTLADTYGMAPLEAMSFKLPIIISNMKYCGFSEHLNKNQAVILKNPKDEIELAEKINFLFENIKERNKIAENGYELSKKISWEATLHKTLSAYNLITSQSR